MEILSAGHKETGSKGRIATVGMFDGVHLGHRHLLHTLISEGAERRLTPMAVTFNTHPLKVVKSSRQAPPSVTTLSERLQLLESTGLDECLLLDFTQQLMSLTARDFLRMLRDDYGVMAFVTGFNNRFGCDTALTFDDYCNIAAEENIELIRASEFSTGRHDSVISSSAIRTLIATDGNVTEAAMMLGRPYSLSGTVVHGKALGRTIGFPTANLRPDSPDKIIPLKGVYACQATISDQSGDVLPAMVNVGDRPTFDDSLGLSIEAHIIGLNHDIYGQPLTLHFLRRLRDERRFHSPQALKEQLSIDLDQTIALNKNSL